MDDKKIISLIKKKLKQFKKISYKTDLDSQYVLIQLNDILNLKDETLIIIRLQLFLENRWQIIAGGEHSYLHKPNHPNTLLCLYIAKLLQKNCNKDKTVYQFLMPSIKKRFNCVTREYDLDSYKLDQLVISEDLSCLIPASLMASLTVTLDGLEQLFSPYIGNKDGVSPRLTPYEQEALIRHNSKNAQLFSLHQQIKKLQNHKCSIGDHLNALTVALRKGGTTVGNGEDSDAGSTAYIGLKEFFYHFNCVDPAKKKRLRHMKIGPQYGGLTLGSVLDTLEGKNTIRINCVDVNAGCIETFLQNHPDLYSEYGNLQIYKARYQSLQRDILYHTSGQDTVRPCLYDINNRYQNTGEIDAIAYCQAMILSKKTEQEIVSGLKKNVYIFPNKDDRAYLDLAYKLARLKYKKLFWKLKRVFPSNVIRQTFDLVVDENNFDLFKFLLNCFNRDILKKPNIKLAKAAIKLRKKSILGHCLQYQVDPFLVDDDNVRLINYALSQLAYEYVDMMLMQLVEARQGYNIYTNGLYHAINNGCNCPELYDYLLQPGKADLQEKLYGQTLFEIALSKDNWPFVNKLVNRIIQQTNPPQHDVYELGRVLLEAACQKKLNLAKRCITPYTNFSWFIEEGRYDGFNALHFAILFTDYVFLKALLNAGAMPDKILHNSKYGISAMDLAIGRNDDKAILCILTNHKHNNEARKAHTRFLHKAIKRQNIKLVKKILEHGIPDLGRVINEKSAIDIAIKTTNMNIIELLMDFGSLNNIKLALAEKVLVYFLFLSIKKGRSDWVIKCAPLIDDFSYYYNSGEFKNFTMLHLAIYFKDYKSLAALLDAGALPHFSVNENYYSAYEYANTFNDKKAIALIRAQQEKREADKKIDVQRKHSTTKNNAVLKKQSMFAMEQVEVTKDNTNNFIV